MEKKCFQLLKELLLRQTQGAFEVLDKSIDLTIDLYCEISNIEREKFVKELNEVAHSIWDKYDGDFKNWHNYQKLYERVIDTLEVE